MKINENTVMQPDTALPEDQSSHLLAGVIFS